MTPSRRRQLEKKKRSSASPRSTAAPLPSVQTSGKDFSTSPRTITPTSSYDFSSPSWEDFDEGPVYASAQKARRHQRSLSASASFSSATAPTASANTSFEDEDMMPMDEMMATAKSPRQYRPNVERVRKQYSFPSVPSSPSSLTTRLNQLEEKLREAENTMRIKEDEHDTEVRAIQRVLAEMTTEREEETTILHETIQSLSKAVDDLQAEKKAAWKSMGRSTPPPPPPPPALPKRNEEELSKLKGTIRDLEAERQSFKKEIERKTRRVMVLERDYKVARVQLRKAEDENRIPENVSLLEREIESLKLEIEELKERKSEADNSSRSVHSISKLPRKPIGIMTPPRPESAAFADAESVSSAMSTEEVESLQKNLSDTTSSLENAKKIIASLENANGSMAVDLRAKLKAKEEELASVQNESAERKRLLDSLATELRDLQKKQDNVDLLEKESKNQIVRHKALMGLLEKSVSGLQAASVVHEVSTTTGLPDQGNVDHIAEILNDAAIGIRTSLEISDRFMDEFDDASDVYTDVDVSSDVGRHVDAFIKNDREVFAKSLRDKLEQKNIAVRRLEEALKKQNEEIKRIRIEQRSSSGNEELLAEIQSLREQCSTNMEVLAKKERELSVLRSSLNVDENDAGYISDDASDADEDENDTAVSPVRLDGYGPAETEALATLMAAGATMSGRESELKAELLRALGDKEKASKELQTEKESLANAKLIISSLEKANKSMMEDLRSRLQDSNTAIASLLDKSMEHERNANELREEVEKLRNEKMETEAQHELQIKKYKDEAKVYSLRISAKERELNDIKRGGSIEVSLLEEKKEEGAEDDQTTGSC